MTVWKQMPITIVHENLFYVKNILIILIMKEYQTVIIAKLVEIVVD